MVSLHAELSCLQVKEVQAPELHRAGELRHGDQASGGLALAVAHMARRHDMTTPQYDLAGEVQAQAHLVRELELALDIPPAWGYLICALLVIPLVTHGVTAISRLQAWTQPLWLFLLILPYVFLFLEDPGVFEGLWRRNSADRRQRPSGSHPAMAGC